MLQFGVQILIFTAGKTVIFFCRHSMILTPFTFMVLTNNPVFLPTYLFTLVLSLTLKDNIRNWDLLLVNIL